MNQTIRDIIIRTGIYDCILDPFDQLKNGDTYSSILVDLEKFAELIVRECAKISLECGINLNREDFRQGIARNIKQHFGVE
jgi:hypothetical protein